jgi:hypothetical protein
MHVEYTCSLHGCTRNVNSQAVLDVHWHHIYGCHIQLMTSRNSLSNAERLGTDFSCCFASKTHLLLLTAPGLGRLVVTLCCCTLKCGPTSGHTAIAICKQQSLHNLAYSCNGCHVNMAWHAHAGVLKAQ